MGQYERTEEKIGHSSCPFFRMRNIISTSGNRRNRKMEEIKMAKYETWEILQMMEEEDVKIYPYANL